eukprot:Em0009g77a
MQAQPYSLPLFHPMGIPDQPSPCNAVLQEFQLEGANTDGDYVGLFQPKAEMSTQHGLLFACSLSPVHDGKAVVQLVNPSAIPVTLHCKEKVGQVSPWDGREGANMVEPALGTRLPARSTEAIGKAVEELMGDTSVFDVMTLTRPIKPGTDFLQSLEYSKMTTTGRAVKLLQDRAYRTPRYYQLKMFIATLPRNIFPLSKQDPIPNYQLGVHTVPTMSAECNCTSDTNVAIQELNQF